MAVGIRRKLFVAGLIAPLLILLLVGLDATSALAKNVKLAWTLGWDDFSQPLDLVRSFVRYNHPPSTSDLSVTYSLKGAVPKTSHLVGVHLFWASTSQCVTTFGQFTPSGPCGSVTRQDVTRVVQSFEFGTLTTNTKGNGNFTVNVSGIAPGTYELEFHVRIGAEPPCPVCNVIYQSPGPVFGQGTVSITIP